MCKRNWNKAKKVISDISVKDWLGLVSVFKKDPGNISKSNQITCLKSMQNRVFFQFVLTNSTH